MRAFGGSEPRKPLNPSTQHPWQSLAVDCIARGLRIYGAMHASHLECAGAVQQAHDGALEVDSEPVCDRRNRDGGEEGIRWEGKRREGELGSAPSGEPDDAKTPAILRLPSASPHPEEGRDITQAPSLPCRPAPPSGPHPPLVQPEVLPCCVRDEVPYSRWGKGW